MVLQMSEEVPQRRKLTIAELKVRTWILKNRGIMSKLSKELGVSIAFLHKVAYGKSEARSKGLRVEHRLLAAGCPLKQQVR